MPIQAPTCRACKLALKGEYRVADKGDSFHIKCFKCAKCDEAFRQVERYAVRTTDNQERKFAHQPSFYYHVDCAPAQQDLVEAADPKCVVCHRGREPGRDEMMTTRRGDAVHLDCFKCTACGQAVDADSDGKVKMTLLSSNIQQLQNSTYRCEGCRLGGVSRPELGQSRSSEPKLPPPAPAGAAAPAGKASAAAPVKAEGLAAAPAAPARHDKAAGATAAAAPAEAAAPVKAAGAAAAPCAAPAALRTLEDLKDQGRKDGCTFCALKAWLSDAEQSTKAAPAKAKAAEAAVAPTAPRAPVARVEKAAAAAPTAAAARLDKAPAALPQWTLEDLKDKDKCHLAGIPPTNREAYLADAEFEAVFGIDKAKFNALPLWRQDKMKREHGLF